MRASISQTVRNVLRKGRSRRPSGLNRRDLGEQQSSSEVEQPNTSRASRHSFRHDHHLSFHRSRRLSVGSDQNRGSFVEASNPTSKLSARRRRGKSTAIDELQSADEDPPGQSRFHRPHWPRSSKNEASSPTPPPTSAETNYQDSWARMKPHGEGSRYPDISTPPNQRCFQSGGPVASYRTSKSQFQDPIGGCVRKSGVASPTTSASRSTQNRINCSSKPTGLNFSASPELGPDDLIEDQRVDDFNENASVCSLCTIPGPSNALSIIGTPTDLTQFFVPKPWAPARFKSIRKIGEDFSRRNLNHSPANAIHGEVRCAKDIAENRHVVVKVIRNSSVRPRDIGELENPLIEIGAMTYLHSNRAIYPVDLVARLYGVYQDPKYTYLVTEHCSGGELFREVVFRKFFHERHVKAIALQLALALLSLHKNGICHRDISLENTLLAGDRTIRLIDFGQAEAIFDREGRPKLMTGSAGKDYYRAPEMISGAYYGPPVDVFALGVEIFIMAVGSEKLNWLLLLLGPPWNEATQTDARYRNLTSRTDALDIALRKWGKRDSLSDAFIDLITGIFCTEADKRPTIEDLFLHPWFALDCGIWRWVDARGHSVTIRRQVERVEKYLKSYPRGKFFFKPCGVSSGADRALFSSMTTKTIPEEESLVIEDNEITRSPPRQMIYEHQQQNVRRKDGAAARHRRPHA